MNSEKQKSYELQNIVSHSEAIIPPPIWKFESNLILPVNKKYVDILLKFYVHRLVHT